ncbi:MAG TPA: hypothetical protein VFA18_13995 [Gemmataceae bacterium]|nr:hypothetical protein [Gemmataceae bacterium]
MGPDQQMQARLSGISTRWSLVLDAHRDTADQRREAQRVLLLRYCGAVYRYIRGAVRDEDVAEVLTQEFALRFVRGDFHRASQGKGRFRDFLRVALQNLVTDHFRSRRRKPPAQILDDAAQLPAPEPEGWASDAEFIQRWRQELLDKTWEALAEEEQRTGTPYHTVLRWRAENPEAQVAGLAEQLSRERGRPFTEAGIRQTLHRAREKYADLLVEEVAGSLENADADRLEEELIELELLAYCRSALARRGTKGG